MSNFLKVYGDCQGPLDFPMKDDDARDLEKKLESGEYSPFKLQKSALEYFIEGEKADVSVITDSSVDKDGDVVDPDSISFEKYRKNPVVTYSHNYEIPPLGTSIWQKRVGNSWKAKTTYTSKPEDYPKEEVWFPESIFHMIKSGTMRGKSIGGAVKWDAPTESDAKRLNFDLSEVKRITRAVDIWEYSVCSIGVNSNTVVELVSKGLQLPEFLITEFPEVKKYIDEMKKREEQTDPEIPMIKSFISVSDFHGYQQAKKQQKIQELEAAIPQMVDIALKKMLGKVC